MTLKDWLESAILVGFTFTLGDIWYRVLSIQKKLGIDEETALIHNQGEANAKSACGFCRALQRLFPVDPGNTR